MFAVADVPMSPAAPAGTPYGCGGGPRFGPAAFDKYGPGAWPSRFGYGNGVIPVLVSTPGGDPRGYDPFAVIQVTPPGAAGVIANGGFSGGSGGAPSPAPAGAVGAAAASCDPFGSQPTPKWAPAAAFSRRAGAAGIAESDGEGLSDLQKGLLWVGAGLVLVSMFGDMGGSR